MLPTKQYRKVQPPVHLCGSGDGVDCGAMLQSLINAKTWPTLIVDGSARPITFNGAAMELLRQEGEWRLAEGGSLALRDADATSELRDRIRCLAEPEGRRAGRSAYFVDRECGSRTLVSLTQIDSARGKVTRSVGRFVVLVSLIDGSQGPGEERSIKLLRDVLGLTLAEARLALALIGGASLYAYCDQAGIHVTTARWHMRKSMAKTGCNSQRDFVRLLLSLLEY